MATQSKNNISFSTGIITTAILLYGLYATQSLLIPLIIAFFLAYIISALSSSISSLFPEAFKFSDFIATIIALTAVGLLLWLFGVLLFSNISQVSDSMPGYQANLDILLEKAADTLNLDEVPTLGQVATEIGNRINLQRRVGDFASAMTSVAGNMFMIILYTIFILLERGALKDKILKLGRNKEQRTRIQDAMAHITEKIRKYIALKTLVSIFVAGASWVIMTLIGIDFAGFWTALIFLLNFIPYIGSFIAVAFPVMLTLIQFGDTSLFVIALVSLMSAQVIVGNIIEPRLMGQSLNLSPLVILMSMVVWGKMWGIMGAFLCVPITVIMMIIFAQFKGTKDFAVLLSKDGNINLDS